MYRRLFKLIGLPAVAMSALLWSAGAGLAQRGGHGGGGHGGGGHGGGFHGGGGHVSSFHGGGGHVSSFHGGAFSRGNMGGVRTFGGVAPRSFNGGFNRGFNHSFNNGFGRGFDHQFNRFGNNHRFDRDFDGRFNRGFNRFGFSPFGFGFYPWYYGGLGSLLGYGLLGGYGGYGLDGYGGDDGYGYSGYGSSFYAPATDSFSTVNGYSQPNEDYSLNPPQGSGQALSPTDVVFYVHVPANAEVSVNGTPSTQTGEVREYASSSLQPNKTYTYSFRARWLQNGRPVDETRKLRVTGGEVRNVDFAQPPTGP
jgi:uncharacterized protein (TIGR03000 family)